MKNLTSSIVLVALMSLLYLFSPGNALAQDDGDIPCCYYSPSSFDPLTNAGIQSMVMLTKRTGQAIVTNSLLLGSELAPYLADDIEPQISTQFVAESQISFAETRTLGLFPVRDREIYYGDHT